MDRDGQTDHPIQREDFDLSKDPRELRKLDKPAPDRRPGPVNPLAMMRSMGFEPTKAMTPLQFLCAVMNDDLERVFENPTRRDRMMHKGGIGLTYRIEAAKAAAKYMHMEMPKVQISTEGDAAFGEGLARAIAAGNERVRTREEIIQVVERVSPQGELPPVHYPPAFDAISDVIEVDVQEDLTKEDDGEGGDIDFGYDPDNDD